MSHSAYDKKRRCPVCLKEFWAARRSAIYCTAKCRVRAHRKPAMEERIGKYYDEAHSGIMSLVAVHDRGVESYRAQQRLKSLCFEILQNINDQTRQLIYVQLADDFYRLRDNLPENVKP